MVSSVDDSIHDFLDLPTPGPGDPKTPTDHCADHHFAQELEAPRRSQQQHHHMLTATTQGTYTFDPDLTTDISDLVFDSPTGPRTPTNNTLSSSSSTRRSCSCQMQAMSTNEAIEIISWSQKDSCSDIYDVLQRQKAALGRFEDLLGCRECTVQPSYVMMLLSMYQRLLETLEKMSRGPGEEGDNDDDDDGGDGGVEWRKRNRDDSYENRSSSAGGSTGQRGGYGISIRRQRLDDDDESLVLKSLVIMRAKMLRRIVVRVDELVSQHNWPVHKRICRELQSLLDSVLMA